MAKDKKGFILYADQKELFDQLPNEKAGELIKHIFAYVNDEQPITEDLLINLAFTPIKQQFKRDLEKWETTREGRSKAGKASAEARKNKKQQESTNSTNVKSVQQNSTNPTVNDNVNVTVNDKVKVNDKVIKNIESRKAEFKNSLLPFLETYDKSLLKEFFEYWTEHGLNDKKMRFEKQKSFGISRRLSTWLKNDKKFKEKDSAKKETFSESVFGKDKHDLILAQLKQNDIDNEAKQIQ